MEDFLKLKETCITYCKNFFEDEPIDECIKNLKKEHGSHICSLENESKESVNEILNNKNFLELINLLIKLLRFLYSVRCFKGNKYDSNIITQIANIDIKNYGLSFEKLNNLDFPGDGSRQNYYPSSFGVYLQILKKLNVLPINYNDPLLKKYKKFAFDFQPWSAMLNTFINVLYDKNDNIKKLLPHGKIPDIRNKDDYCKKKIIL